MLPPLHAERQLAAIEAAMMPNLPANVRGNVFRRLRRNTDPAPQAWTAAEALASLPIPIIEEPTRKTLELTDDHRKKAK